MSTGAVDGRPGGCLEASHRCHPIDDHDRMAPWRGVGLRWSEIAKQALKFFSCNGPARVTEIIVGDRRD
jgi:hypothetical protein